MAIPYCNTIYIATGWVDMRKSIDGLSAIVQERFKLSVCQAAMFAFCNRQRNKLKILIWDETGFWLYYKRLEQGTFKWPQHTPKNTEQVQCIGMQEFNWLLSGLTLVQRDGHKKVSKKQVI
jgi:transposase